MTRRDLLILFIIGLAVPLGIAQFQSLPGYMDADYYFGGGVQLMKGNGFTEPYLWNYLDDPQGLPHPSHAYWMPLASIVAAAGMWITGRADFASARLGFLLLAALVPPLASLLAHKLTGNRALAFLSGLLAAFPIYYAPFLPVPDNYAIYMVLGALYFLLITNLNRSLITVHCSLITFFLLGLTSAAMTLARSDGLLWLGISFLVAVWFAGTQVDRDTGRQVNRYTGTQVDTYTRTQVDTDTHSTLHPPRNTQHGTRNTQLFIFHLSSFILFLLLGFLLLMSPWYARNLHTFGSLMAPGGSRALWLTDYNDTFAFPAGKLTMVRWLASGWDSILQARVHALRLNLLNAFAAQGGIFLFPFIVIGLWQFRKDIRVRFALLAWTLLLLAMTLVFPFAGERGAFYHAGAALQPIWWAMAPVGLETLVAAARKRGLFDQRAFAIFRGALVGIAVLMTAVIFIVRVLPGWEREDGQYRKVEILLVQKNVPADAIIILRNPPGFNIVTGRPAIALPNGGLLSVQEVAKKYNADYLLLEPNESLTPPCALCDQANSNPNFRFLGESDGVRLYEIHR